MPTDAPSADDCPVVSSDSLPNTLADGRTLLVACPGSPARFAFGLQALAHAVNPDDTAVLVTTTESATRAIERYEHFATDAPEANLEVVDTASEVQSLDAVYDEVPTIFTPSPGDLERLMVALSDLTENALDADTDRHLVVRSLTPILESTPLDRVHAVLERITGLRTDGGVCLLGIDYTAHDRATVDELAAATDGVLWLSRPTSDRVDVEYEPTGDRHRTR